MIKFSMAHVCAYGAGIFLVTATSFAGTTSTGKEAKPLVEQVKESCISGDIGINVVSQYISRGVIFENQGAILQPFADLYFKIYEGEGALNAVTLNLGIWNSFHSRKTDAGLVNGAGTSSTRSWFEVDFTAGISFTFAKNFTITPSYFTFLSPNDGFSTFHGVNLKVAYDTTDLLGFNLAPYAQVLWEAENKAGSGADEGFYYEVGIAPSFPAGPVTLSFPLVAGFGSDDFYGSLNEDTGAIEDEAFGFVSGGVNVAYNLAFIPECYGTWTINANATYYYLGEGTRDYNTAKRGGTVRDHDEHEFVFGGGLVVAF